MKYTISSLSFEWGRIKKLRDIPDDFGFELFWECGSEDNWNNAMSIIQQNHCHRISVHAPYFYVDLSRPGDEVKMFDELKRPFDFYHRNNAEFYVVHTFDHMDYPFDAAVEADCRKRAVERLGKFDEICKAEDILMVAENIAFGNGERYLFNHEQFLDIFRQLPKLHCLIDLGHAALTDIDVYKLQACLRERIIAYHLHDNDGRTDSHKRMWMGCREWARFAEGVKEYTPKATGVMEYYGFSDLQDYLDDSAKLESLIV